MQIQDVSDHVDLERVVPFFQPVIDLDNNAVWCYECLARLVQPGVAPYLPSDFLHLIERQRASGALTESIFLRSADYFRHINMAWNINISHHDMLDPELLPMLQDYMVNYPNPGRVSLELMASTATEHLDTFDNFVSQCTQLGLGLIIDHYGAQNAEHSVLLEYPLRAVKIDGSRVGAMATSPDRQAWVEEVIAQGAKRKIPMIAEHIEDSDTLSQVRQVGLRLAQGFYFSQPDSSIS